MKLPINLTFGRLPCLNKRISNWKFQHSNGSWDIFFVVKTYFMYFIYGKCIITLYIVCMHRYKFRKLWGLFSQLSTFLSFFCVQKSRTRSVFMLQRWFAYQNEGKSTWKRLSFLDFSFFVLVFCNWDLYFEKFMKNPQKLDFIFFIFEGV